MKCEFLTEILAQGRDPLAEATNGAFHWNNPGMDDSRTGWEEFVVGMRVEVRTIAGWLPGTIRQIPQKNDEGIDVECDWRWHDSWGHYSGKGVYIPLDKYSTRRELWSVIRTIPEENTIPSLPFLEEL